MLTLLILIFVIGYIIATHKEIIISIKMLWEKLKND